MEKTLAALGDILLKALPTFFLVIFLYAYLRRMFFQPMDKMLAARREATEGARQRAEEAMRLAEQKTAQYESSLEAVRVELRREQQAERQRALQLQAARLRETRAQAEQRLAAARQSIAAEAAAARASIEARNAALAEQVIGAVLGKGAAA